MKDRISFIKSNSAPGLDGIKRGHLRNKNIHNILAKFYNLLLKTGTIPTSCKSNRTVLLPKEGKFEGDINSYRPVTISSLLCRIFFGILDQKLRAAIDLNSRQKGFVPEPGCFNNVHLLNEIIKYGKRNAGLSMIQLDVAKAFDTIPHDAIGPALKRKGVPHHIINII